MNQYEEFFLQIVNLSLTGGFVILGVMAARLFLKKAPRIYAYVLWAIAGIRLICPVVLPSFFSLIPVKQQAVVYEKLAYQMPEIDSGLSAMDTAVGGVMGKIAPPAPSGSVNPMQIYITLAALVWGVTAVGVLLWGVINMMFLKGRLKTAVLVEQGRVPVYETDRLDSPILLGFIRPAIYLPVTLSQTEQEYVLAHERVHVKRRDHLWKALAYVILALHWFNPFVWVAFYLFTKDMEMSCDESVMKGTDGDIRVPYSETLLKLAMRQSGLLTLSPLAFGENNTRSRVKNVLRFKKPAALAAIPCVLVICVAAVLLLTENKRLEEQAVVDTVPVAESGYKDLQEMVDTQEAMLQTYRAMWEKLQKEMILLDQLMTEAESADGDIKTQDGIKAKQEEISGKQKEVEDEILKIQKVIETLKTQMETMETEP